MIEYMLLTLFISAIVSQIITFGVFWLIDYGTRRKERKFKKEFDKD